MSQGYLVMAGGVPLRPDDILALMPPAERQFAIERIPTLFAFCVYAANLLADRPPSRQPRRRPVVKSKPRNKKQSKQSRKEQAMAVVAEALRIEPQASLKRLATMTSYSRSYCCELRGELRKDRSEHE